MLIIKAYIVEAIEEEVDQVKVSPQSWNPQLWVNMLVPFLHTPWQELKARIIGPCIVVYFSFKGSNCFKGQYFISGHKYLVKFPYIPSIAYFARNVKDALPANRSLFSLEPVTH